jgi:esterase/lipase
LNFLKKNFAECDKYFYIDTKINRYHLWLEGLTTNIDDTVEYLKKIISSYKYVNFIGVSAGGYVAILFGSLLNVTNVIAFIAPTQTNMLNDKKVEAKFPDAGACYVV